MYTLRMINGYSTFMYNIAPGKYIDIKVEYRLQLHFKIFFFKNQIGKTQPK